MASGVTLGTNMASVASGVTLGTNMASVASGVTLGSIQRLDNLVM